MSSGQAFWQKKGASGTRKKRGVQASASSRGTARLLVIFALGVGVAFSGISAFPHFNPDVAEIQPAASTQPQSHYALLAMKPEQLGQVDFALMNLLCAGGLPGSENLDIRATLAKLDEWAAKVKSETERHLYRVTDPRYAEHYDRSEARLRAEFIVQVLQEDCGVHYNEARIDNPDFRNAQDIFIHGMIGNDNGGTCASMPILYTAIGRRLGYPMKLVLAREHIFCRWDDGGERFNIEGATNGGVDYFPDDHYRRWPKRISDEAVESGEFLKSLTPSEELSVFLFNRGICCHKNGQLPQARVAFAEAARLRPQGRNERNALFAVVVGQGGSRRPQRDLSKIILQGNPRDPTPSVPTPRVP